MSNTKRPKLRVVTSRFFSDDIDQLQKIAEASRLPWQIELRQLVHRALMPGGDKESKNGLEFFDDRQA